MSNPYSSSEQHSPHSVSQVRVSAVRVLQIITFAMLMGTSTFLVIALVIKQGAVDGEPDILAWMGLGMAGLTFLIHFVAPGVAAASALNQIDSEELRSASDDAKFEMLASAFRLRHIIACALLEGAAFFNLVIYILTRYVGNVIAAVVLLALIAARFPTLSKLEFWVQDRVREIELR